ncbi:autotransporter outer membrane beta-barrel domain-containing protein [Achromobacter veterisilvae]|uniref:Autotransporter outer membrane beta-barrel domain-containing protein n=1 Tax=Achromobacter veterisilvae TaxID=2069367 RepID=A0ABZ2RV45_9BURK
MTFQPPFRMARPIPSLPALPFSRRATALALAAACLAPWQGAAAAPPPASNAAQIAALKAAQAEYRKEVEARGANAVALGQTASILLLDTELGTVGQRQGELRNMPDKGGLWVRGTGSNYKVETANASRFGQDASAISVGADYAWTASSAKVYLGAFVGLSQSEQNAEYGTRGKIDSRYAGIYLSYVHDNGLYVDVVNKVGRIDQDVRFDLPLDRGTYSDGVSHTTYSGSVELGYHWRLADRWFIEPQLQGIYSRSSQTSIEGRAGLRAGRDFGLAGGGTLQPYAKVSYLKQFSHDDTVGFGDSSYDVALPGNRWQLGGGVAVASGRHRAFVDLQYGRGASVSQEVTANIGYSFRF